MASAEAQLQTYTGGSSRVSASVVQVSELGNERLRVRDVVFKIRRFQMAVVEMAVQGAGRQPIVLKFRTCVVVIYQMVYY